MARRSVEIDGECWSVFPSGRVTTYSRDEFGLLFECGTGPGRKRRVTRYHPMGANRRDQSLAELSDRDLIELFRSSQPAWTSPEAGYVHRTD